MKTDTTPTQDQMNEQTKPESQTQTKPIEERLNEPALINAPANPHDRPEDSAAIAQANIDRPLDRDATAKMITDFKGKCQALNTPPVR